MGDIYNKYCITSCTSTILNVMGLQSPENTAPPIAPVVNKYKIKADRVFLYNPDAIALWLYMKYTDKFSEAMEVSDIAIPLLSVMPSVTPVCFASMYTGLTPDIHGIKRYEKPVLKVDTLFDCLIKAGKKCAIVSTTGDSISKIFLEREMDYYIFDEDDELNNKVTELIDRDIYDLIVVYDGVYDFVMHRYGPESKESLEAIRTNVLDYAKYIKLIKEKWTSHNTFFGFMPDHGCHEIDGGCGSHGLDMEEDMNIIHFYGFNKAKEQ